MELKKEFKCGQTVYLMIDNAPMETKIRALNTLERLTEKGDVSTLSEYFVEGIDAKVPTQLLFNSIDELLNSFRPGAANKKNKEDK